MKESLKLSFFILNRFVLVNKTKIYEMNFDVNVQIAKISKLFCIYAISILKIIESVEPTIISDNAIKRYIKPEKTILNDILIS